MAGLGVMLNVAFAWPRLPPHCYIEKTPESGVNLSERLAHIHPRKAGVESYP